MADPTVKEAREALRESIRQHFLRQAPVCACVTQAEALLNTLDKEEEERKTKDIVGYVNIPLPMWEYPSCKRCIERDRKEKEHAERLLGLADLQKHDNSL